MAVAQKIKTLFWFASRPKYWSQGWSIAMRSRNKEKEATRDAAEAWAREHSVQIEDVLNGLGFNKSAQSFDVEHANDLNQAKQKAQEAPVQMGGAGNLDLLHSILSNLGEIHAIETGVAYGWSSLVFLLHLTSKPGALISVDMPYVHMNNDPYVGCIVPDELRTPWTLLRTSDRKGLPKALKTMAGKLNVCHYDSDKSYTGRMWAYPLLWDALCSKGIFISDDIGDNLGFSEFAVQTGAPFWVVEDNGRFVGVIQKT